MSTLRTIALTAAVCLPLGALAKGAMLKGHPNLQRAHAALTDAERWIGESQKANEHIWEDEGGHGQRAKEAIEKAKHELDEAAAWVNEHANDKRERHEERERERGHDHK
jgi:hypothetical protein